MFSFLVLGLLVGVQTPGQGSLPPGGAANAQAGATDTAALRKIAEDLNRKQIEAFNKGDMLGVAKFYADDATIYYPHYPTRQGRQIRGREEINKYWLAVKKPKEWKLEVHEVGGTPEAIWVIGRTTLTHVVDGKDSTYAADFVVIWKRQPDGSYRIHTDMYT